MWVYSYRLLPARLKLDIGSGAWLDYWLFLHADETPAVFAARPISLHSLLEALDLARATAQWSLMEAVTTELRGYRHLQTDMPHAFPSVEPVVRVPAHGGGKRRRTELAHEWSQWVRMTARDISNEELTNALVGKLDAVPGGGRLSSDARFATRRIASEVSEWRSAQQIVGRSLRALAEGAVSPREILSECLRHETAKGYVVALRLSASEVSKAVPMSFGDPRLQLTAEVREGRRFITGASVSVTAVDEVKAADEALEIASRAISNLRLRYYVRTHLYGSVTVRQTIEEEPIHLSLAQPFWTKAEGRRRVPALSRLADEAITASTQSEVSRLAAARWHFALAVGLFSEDPHAAASLVWQGLEAIHQAGPEPVYARVAPDFIARLPEDMIKFVAGKLFLQRRLMVRNGMQTDWYTSFNPDQPEVWIQRVLASTDRVFYRRWRYPPAPDVIFDPQYGVLQAIGRLSPSGARTGWALDRTVQDLRHLYALRNVAAHAGRQVGNRRWAAFLARLGLEAGMNELIATGASLLPKKPSRTKLTIQKRA